MPSQEEEVIGDEDSSDEDDEEVKADDSKKEDSKKEEAKPPPANPFGDDSDDDSSDGGGEKKKQAEPEKKKEEKDPFAEEGESDDNDDDNEKKKKESEKKDKTNDSSDDDDDDIEEAEAERIGADDAQVDELSPKQPTAPKIDPRTMVVLEPTRPPEDTTLHVTKLPNLVGIQPDAFDPATYSARAEEEEYGHVLDMMRWRYKKDKDGQMMRDEQNGKLIRESNARLIQWEDGSYTLHVGKEALQVDSVDSSKKMGQMNVLTGRTATFAGLNGYLYLSQMATNREPNDEEEKEGDTNKPEKETPAGTVLECMGSVGSRMTARPSSLASEAHKSLTVAVRQRTMKRAKIAQVITQLDPEKEKEKKIQQKMQFEKEQARKKNYGDGYSSRARSNRPRMTSRYMEDDGDYDTIGLGSLKKRTMNSDEEDFDDYADEMDDDDEEEETFNRKRPKKRAGASNRKSLDSDDDDDDDDAAADGGKDDSDDDQEEDDEVITPVKSSKKRTHQAVFDDDDSDD
ncbi:Protein LEO1 [Seminavis robusta]|uniref:Protein LEO1 n=1 Tax=Seminavis robusta TaxID=568900 RepID=A0A9N8EQY3_9STRA|nr:Protein LEO1 [Seminavis robusta]|eukprot:Sro1699_g292050.1 Protein LEO1 (514) ;mRNA; r:14287-16032